MLMQTSSQQTELPFIGIAEIAVIVIVILILMAAAKILFGGKKTVIVQQRSPMSSQKIMVRCPSCKSLNDEDATFCSNCGGKLQASSVPKALAKVYCVFCGAQMSDSPFCPKCGKSNI